MACFLDGCKIRHEYPALSPDFDVGMKQYP